MALSSAPGFLIEELTGQQRSVALTGWALPRQNVGFGRRNRTKKRTYAGNPVATVQVLGPELDDSTIEGTWSDRYLPGQVFVAGFDQPDTCEALVAVFDELTKSAQQIRVQWGSVVRFGVIASFEPTWIRLEDCAWSLEFTWTGEESQRVRAGPIEVEDDDIRAAIVAMDDEVVLSPSTLQATALSIGDSLATTDDRLTEVRRSVVGVLFALGDLRQRVDDQIQPALAVVSLVDTVRTTVGQVLVELEDIPYTYSTVYDSVVDVLDVECWRRTVASRAGGVRGASMYKAIEVNRIPQPKNQTVVQVRTGQTLRSIAVDFYGDADAWERIADANNLVSSQVAPGTRLVVPLPEA